MADVIDFTCRGAPQWCFLTCLYGSRRTASSRTLHYSFTITDWILWFSNMAWVYAFLRPVCDFWSGNHDYHRWKSRRSHRQYKYSAFLPSAIKVFVTTVQRKNLHHQSQQIRHRIHNKAQAPDVWQLASSTQQPQLSNILERVQPE